jgi:dCTP deaminase
MSFCFALTSLQYRCPWAYYTGLFWTLRSLLLGTTPRNNYAATIAVKNHAGTDALIDRRIRELCLNADMVSPFSFQAVQPCSYDVHLGQLAKIETQDGFKNVDLSRYSPENPLFLKPGAFMLGETVEYIRLPDNVEAHLHLVSSRAREGLNHSLAGLVDCGYHGRLTLEIKNILTYGAIPLYPNLRIAQLTFFEYPENARHPYRGRYFEDSQVSGYKDGTDLLRL